MCKETSALRKPIFGPIIGVVLLALLLAGCSQTSETNHAIGKSSSPSAEPTPIAEPADFLASPRSEESSPGLLGAPAGSPSLGTDERPDVSPAPTPGSASVAATPPEALALTSSSSTTTASSVGEQATPTTTAAAPGQTGRLPTTFAPAGTSGPTPTSTPAQAGRVTSTTATPTTATPTTATPTTATPTTATPTTAAPTTATPTTATPTTTSTQAPPVSSERYTVDQIIDGTISAGDGSNPNEEAPMGRHDAPLSLNQGWNWATGPTRNSVWGELGTGDSQFAEFRCAVIPESGHTPTVPFRVNIQEGAYYQYVNNNWQKAFDVDLTGGNHGGYLGTAGETDSNPFDSGSHGLIEWRLEADGSFSAPWNPDALMMHFWASEREAPAAGQTAEFLTSEFRLQQPDDQTVDLSQVQVLFQCGVDYYATTGSQGTQVPGPGIGKYHRLTTQWEPSLWVTLPKDEPADSVSDFRTWLEANLPPGVSR